MSQIELGAAIVGANTIQYSNKMGLPKSIGEYIAARAAIVFIWSVILSCL